MTSPPVSPGSVVNAVWIAVAASAGGMAQPSSPCSGQVRPWCGRRAGQRAGSHATPSAPGAASPPGSGAGEPTPAALSAWYRASRPSAPRTASMRWTRSGGGCRSPDSHRLTTLLW
ncbi:hypothetical protein [Actinokineospora sp. UTMC 2448]|uniref:hypothetical protein n=1 Tax=Actinokineospora sp. UTMC 2448 TaxID=2268449 RepID=UPI0021644A17|nr:hypothetical protein [Actinokineospora sp. UTMC 2448]UVS80402.1 hypothetical protein Actkin_04153 [Actinokineospora sp. UTMC 2448]